MNYQARSDGAGVLRACNEHGVSFTYASEHTELGSGSAGTAQKDLRTVSKGSSRGAGPMKKQGRVRGRGGLADDVKLCLHGNAKVCCSSCAEWHCGCPGSPKHVCAERSAA